MASAGCQYVRGACIAGKPGSYRDLRETLLFCWSRLACDGVGGVSVDAWCLHRWQANAHRSESRLACEKRHLPNTNLGITRTPSQVRQKPFQRCRFGNVWQCVFIRALCPERIP